MKITSSSLPIAGAMFFALLFGGVHWAQISQQLQENEQDRLMREIVNAQASALERRIAYALSATYILAQEVKRSAGDFPDFETYADGVLQSIDGISNLQLAPDGIVARIHPLKGNEKALGHNILRDDQRRQEAQLAVDEKRLTLAGPFALVQGGIAIVGRNPIFIDKDGTEAFWGFASALIFLKDLLSVTDLFNLESKGYSYQLSRNHPDTGELDVFARSKTDLVAGHIQIQVIKVPNAQWELRLSNPRRFPITPGYIASFLVALVLAFCLYKLLQQPEKLRRTVEEKTAQLKEFAFHDQLTGLANRRLLNAQLEQEIQRLIRNKKQAALLYIDLDDFKRINDSMGHEAGDVLLQIISTRLLNTLRKNDIVARLGGDEFAILLLDTDSISHVSRTADKLLEVVQRPVPLNDREVIVSATIGITIIPDDGRDVSTLLRNSDLAMYAAKKSGKRRCQFFDPQMQQTASQDLALEQDLHKALANNELFLLYQPIFSLQERRITGYEALIRWRHPSQGVLPPVQFIPVAEESGLVIAMGYWVIRQVCQLIKKREQRGAAPIRIAINLSPQQFADATLGSRIEEIVTEFSVPPQLIELEITETALMDNVESAVSTLTQLRSSGISIAIDDFGTGYASLSQLKRLPVDTLKIDRSFIDEVAVDGSSDQIIVEAILAIANKFKLDVVAEGIESTEQIAFLESNHCGYGQGILFGPPVAEEHVLDDSRPLASDWPTGSNHKPGP